MEGLRHSSPHSSGAATSTGFPAIAATSGHYPTTVSRTVVVVPHIPTSPQRGTSAASGGGPRLTWEELAVVEGKLTAQFGPNLDDMFVSGNLSSSMVVSQPLPVVHFSALPSPRTIDPRRGGINLSDPVTPRSAKNDLRQKVLRALNKTSEELFLAMQAAECALASGTAASFPYRPTPKPVVHMRNLMHTSGDSIETKVVPSAIMGKSRGNLAPTAVSIRQKLRKLSVGDRDMKGIIAAAAESEPPRLRNMEKFHHIAGASGLAALKTAVLGEEVAAADSGADLSAFLNTSSSMASSLVHLEATLTLTTIRDSSNTMVADKDKAERHERLQAFLARRSSWLDMTVAQKPSTMSLSLSGEMAVPEESRSRRKITSTIFRGKKPSLPLLGGNAVNASKAAADYSLDVEPRYITDTHRNAVVDRDSLLLPAFGFRLELGTPLTPEQRAESCKVENLYLQGRDNDVFYYKQYFIDPNEPHVNLLGFDPEIGPIAITSELREKDENERNLVIIRTKKGFGRSSIPSTSSAAEVIKNLRVQEPILANAKFSKVKDPGLSNDLLEMEQKMISKNYKFGILYVKQGQTKENEMFANVESSHAFEEFLDFLGDRIELRDWKGFRGGLDVNRDSTGKHSVHTTFMNYGVMFHVSTLLPFNPDDEQQLERKRHLGNDIVVIIFVDGITPFSPALLKSEFNHTFVVVQPCASPHADGKTHYKIGFADKVGVRAHEPILPDPPVFEKNAAFRQWFLTKLVNAERASLHAPGFRGKIQRTRMLLLKEMLEQYCKKDIMPHADSFSMG